MSNLFNHPTAGNQLAPDLEITGGEWNPSEALAAILWIAVILEVVLAPAIAIAVWKWAL